MNNKLELLAEEAKKYKSAEEFIKAQIELPEKIKMGLIAGKPDVQLKFVGKIGGKEAIRYEGIKSGGIVFQTEGNTKEEAIGLMKKQLEKVGRLVTPEKKQQLTDIYKEIK